MVKAINVANKRSKERLEKLSAKIPKKGKKGAEEVPAEPETKLCPFCLSDGRCYFEKHCSSYPHDQ